MKQILVLFSVMLSQATMAQENIGLLQGGYSMGKGTVTASQPTGFKVNGSWEFQPSGDQWTIGGSLGYLRIAGSESGSDFSVSSIPVCVVSRLMFGSESFMAFVRGQAGTHVSTVSYAGLLVDLSDSQVGMVVGIGGGVMFYASEKTFVSAEYEWLWLSNAFANTGSIGTTALGVGFKF